MANGLSLSILIGASVGGAMSAFGNLRGTMQRVATATRSLQAQQQVLGVTIQNAANLPQAELTRLNTQYARQQQLLTRLRASTQALGRSQAAIAANEASRAQLRGKIMETAGLAYLAAAPVKVAIDAEEAFADVKKVVDERVPELEQYLLDASRRIPASFAELSQIASGGAQGGIVRDELEGYIELVSKMSVAGDLTAEHAGESIAKIKNIFGANIARMGELGDVINNLSNRESAKYAQIIEVMKRAGSSAQMFGLNEQQTAGLATAFLALGKTEETAGTAINAVLLKLSAADVQSAKFQKALARMGLSASGLKKAIGQDAQGALTLFLEKVRQLPKADQMSVMSQMFGTQYADDVSLLAQNIDVFKRAMQEAGDAAQYAGSMQKEFESRSDTTKNAFVLLRNELAALAIGISKTILPALRELIGVIRPALQWIAGFAQEHPVLTKYLLIGIAALIAFKIALLALGYAGLLLAAPFLHLVKIFRLFSAVRALGAVGGLASVFPRLAAAAATAGKVFAWIFGKAQLLGKALFFVGKLVFWLGRALMMNPIGLLITAIAGGAYLIYKY